MADRSVLRQIRQRVSRGSLLSSVVVVVASGALLVAAFDAEGYRTPELKLHDAGVWLSRSSAIGRMNTEIKQVDVRIDLGGAEGELLQHDSTVWVHDKAGVLCKVDGRGANVTSAVAVPNDAVVDLAGASGGPATGALLAGGKLWVEAGDGLLDIGLPPAHTCADQRNESGTGAKPSESAGPEPKPRPPDGVLRGATELVVGLDGVAWAYAPEAGTLLGFNAMHEPAGEEHLSKVPSNHRVELSTVGSMPVVLDRDARKVLLPGIDPISLDDDRLGADPRLQLAGPSRGAVLIATDAGLVEVPISGGRAELVSKGGSGTATRPLYVGGCAFDAWSGGPSYARVCVGQEPVLRPLDARAKGSQLQIRTNRGRVVVNELESGYGFLISEGKPDLVDWQDAVLDPQDESKDPSTSTITNPEDQEKQEPPIAEDDTGDDAFATRPGQAIVVHPMRNDHDPNRNDVLVIKEPLEDVGGCNCLELVDGGLAVQVTPPPGVTDDIRFRYTVNDGYADSNIAEAVVEIHPEDQNEPPRYPSGNVQATTVVSGHTVLHNVLADARDPDGDALSLLVPVKPPAEDGSQGTVTASIDGTIAFHAPGGSADAPYSGTVTVPFTITDGRENGELDGVLTVTVIAPDQATHKPVARGDHATGVVGHELVVDVLANDSDADGDKLRVTHPGSSDTATVVKDNLDRIHVTPSVAGPLILSYTISDGNSAEVNGKLRIDVLADSGAKPPLAVRDDVVLPDGQIAVSDVLLNDTDANGDVLIVEGVAGAEAAGLQVEVIAHRFLRIRAERPLKVPAAFTYSVSDGLTSDTATVVVRPGPAVEPQSPTANDDTFELRAGSIASLDVVANDTDPEGATLTIKPGSVEVVPPDLYKNDVFVQEGKIRFVAPVDLPTTPIQLTYEVIDPTGRSDSATVVISVFKDDKRNAPPQPLEITARTVAGVPVVIPVPVATIDPDGDDVTLLGLDEAPNSAPKHGSVTDVGNDRLTYQSDRWDQGFYGTDSFTYRVRDARGLVALAVIRVGVAAPTAENHPPVAIDDERQTPQARLTIDVLRNDSDPDGDALRLTGKLVKSQPDAPFSVEPTRDGRVLFDPHGLKAGDKADFTYTVSDGILTSTGRVTVTMTDKALVPPVAFDDRHSAVTTGTVVTVRVLENDIDPDGSRDELKVVDPVVVVSGLDAAPKATNSLRFTMQSDDVVLRYTIVDVNGQTADAIVRVRLAAAERPFPPLARHDKATTDEGAAVTVDVLHNDEVMPGPGKEKKLLDVFARDHGQCTRTADHKVLYQPDPGFSGLGGCSYLLGDGPGDAPETLRAVGTVGVTVKRTSNSPPRFVAQTIVLYAKTKLDVDIRSAVVDDDDPHQLERVKLGQPAGAANGVSASLKGTVLHLEAKANALEGAVPLTFTVSDGTNTSVEPGRVVVLVSKYTGPLASLQNDQIEAFETQAAKPQDLLANDIRAIQDEGLTINSVVPPPANQGTIEWDKNGVVTFKPAGTFHGLTSFTYTVNDGTDLPERFQTALVSVNVIGFPDPPAPPDLVRYDSAIGLSWSAPADNGAPIEQYVIVASPGEIRMTTSATSFRFPGLTNGTLYTFKIAAENRANTETGTPGTFSKDSVGIRPERVPDTPGAPTATFVPSGGSVDVAWVAPPANGSEIDAYALRVDPRPPGWTSSVRDALPKSPTQFRVDGLTNGVAYTFAVQAQKHINDAGNSENLFSEWSQPSAPEIPAKVPEAPTKPTITPADLGDGNITIHWVEPNTNGDAISQYHVEYFVNGSSVGTQVVPGTARQTTIQNTDNNKKYTFKVAAENKAGTGAQSPESDAVNSYGLPGPVGAISATEGDRSSVLTFQRPAENGAAIDQYQYRANGGAWTSVGHSMVGTTVTINVSNVLTNGVTYQFQVLAHNARGWAADPGQQSNSIRPFGNPGAPLSFGGNNNGGTKTLTWTWGGSSNLNGHDSSYSQISINGGGWQDAGSGFSVTVPNWGDCRTAQVRSIGNRTSADNRHIGPASGGVQVCSPSPSVSVGKGGAFNPSGCSGGCQRVQVTLTHWNAGSYRYDCYADDPPANGSYGQFWGAQLVVGGDGTYDTDCAYGYANGYVYVVVNGVPSPAVRWGSL